MRDGGPWITFMENVYCSPIRAKSVTSVTTMSIVPETTTCVELLRGQTSDDANPDAKPGLIKRSERQGDIIYHVRVVWVIKVLFLIHRWVKKYKHEDNISQKYKAEVFLKQIGVALFSKKNLFWLWIKLVFFKMNNNQVLLPLFIWFFLK